MKELFKANVGNHEQLDAFSKKLLQHIQTGTLVGFSGELGVGKTELIRALSNNLGFQFSISSPTYNIENKYDLSDNTHISHWDLYRLNQVDEFEQEIIELKQLKKAVIFVEWPDHIKHLLDIHVLLSFAEFNSRDITVYIK